MKELLAKGPLVKRGLRVAAVIALVLSLFRLFAPPLRDDTGFSQALYDREGSLLRLTLARDDTYRLWLPLGSLSPVMIQATLLHEDRWFRFHPGVSPAALVRAVWHTYLKRDRKIGGSTITMQLARIKYGIRSNTPAGKMQQILAALWLELLYSKNDILEAYLNRASYGLNIEGVGAASLIYFHKDADRLTLSDALTLSVIPQSPARRMPQSGVHGPRYPELGRARGILFERWVRAHPADKEEKSLIGLPVVLKLPSDLPFRAPHFAYEVSDLDPFDAVLRTTLDLRLQTLIERHVRSYVRSNRRNGIRNAVVLLVDHRNLAVRALVGSADFFDPAIDGQVNGARAKRSPGSALKPFIYGLGIDQGLAHPLTMLKDAPMSFGAYNPENFDNEFLGPLRAQDALIRSRNVPAVEIASKLAPPGLHGFLLKAGVTRMHDAAYYGMSLALGSAEVTMEELVKLYAMLANDGALKPLRFLADQPEEKGTALLSKEASFLVRDMLSANPPPNRGYQPDWVRNAPRTAWKTGTSFGFRDAWSVGITGPYVLAVWTGNFDGEGNPAFIGRSAAGPLLFEIIDSLRSQDPGFTTYRGHGMADLNLSRVEVCAVSGGLPTAACEHRTTTWFIPGISPIAKCTVHRRVYVNARTGMRACTEGAPGTTSRIYEFWSSDLLAIFRQAGIPRRVPPPYEPGCRMDVTASQGAGPRITSPREQVVYNMRASSLNRERVPLTAVTDADTRAVHWFVNEEYIGRSGSGKPFFWAPRPGAFVVRAVDDQGRAAVREIMVRLVE